MSIFANIAWAEQQKCGTPLERLLLITIVGRTTDTAIYEADYIKLAEFCCCTVREVSDAIEDLARRRLLSFMTGGPDAADLAMPWWRSGLALELDDEDPEFPEPLRDVLMECQKGKCWYCGCDLATHPETPHIEHQVPRSRGGPDKISNLVLSCAPCNESKNARTVGEYRKHVIRAQRKGKDFLFYGERRG